MRAQFNERLWERPCQGVLLAALVLAATPQELPPESRELQREREQLGRTVWAPEQTAQQYEASITRLWDQLRSAKSAAKVFQTIVCGRWIFPEQTESETLELNINRQLFKPTQSKKVLSDDEFATFISGYEEAGYRLKECEFHHTAFQPGRGGRPASSKVGFLLHVEKLANPGGKRLAVNGEADILWDRLDHERIRAREIQITALRVLSAPLQRGFVKAATFERRENEFQSAHPVLLHDLDQDGDSEIVIPRWNRRYVNQLNSAKPRLTDAAFLKHWKPQEECGLLADLNADGFVDYVTVVKNQGLTIYSGAKGGTFPYPGRTVFASEKLSAPMAMTAGDIDSDGDLDLFLTQYKPSYIGGQMPTPFYDANDGFPSFLLRNDGELFVDATEASGLGAKRLRRTYSATFTDLDDDLDLDLSVVSDYAGLDVYQNDGRGNFTDISASFQPNRLFGMAQNIADYDSNGQLDLLAIGMSSSTARRLDSLGLGRKDREDYRVQRSAMGYGNRMYLRSGNAFIQSPFNEQVARTGWSWGASSFDVDNDGDRDIYVANGFRSGKSSKDYCTNYWCQDLYAGRSKENPALVPVFARSMLDLNKGLISWNGYEHNHLKLNLAGKGFENIGFLLGTSFEYDSRIALTEDFDRDGREDLLVSEYLFLGRGFQSKIHLYLNRFAPSPQPNHWIEFILYPSKKQPALGATVILESASRTQVHPIVAGDSFLSQDAYSAHFGLGDEDQVSKVTIRWPGGATSEITDPEIDRIHQTRRREFENSKD